MSLGQQNPSLSGWLSECFLNLHNDYSNGRYSVQENVSTSVLGAAFHPRAQTSREAGVEPASSHLYSQPGRPAVSPQRLLMEHELVSALRTRGLPGIKTDTAMAHMSAAVPVGGGPAIPTKKENSDFPK